MQSKRGFTNSFKFVCLAFKRPSTGSASLSIHLDAVLAKSSIVTENQISIILKI